MSASVRRRTLSPMLSREAVDITIRHVPGHVWVRLFVNWTGGCEPGHGWMYKNIIRRDAWRVGRIGFGVIRMPIEGAA